MGDVTVDLLGPGRTYFNRKPVYRFNLPHAIVSFRSRCRVTTVRISKLGEIVGRATMIPIIKTRIVLRINFISFYRERLVLIRKRLRMIENVSAMNHAMHGSYISHCYRTVNQWELYGRSEAVVSTRFWRRLLPPVLTELFSSIS